MKLILQHSFVFLLLLVCLSASAFETPQGISFKENKGQVSDQFYNPRPDILFSGAAGQLVYHLKNNGISYQLSRVDSWKTVDTFPMPVKSRRSEGEKEPDQITIYRLDVNWLNSNPNAIIKKGNPVEGYDNYYLETCPKGALNVKSFKEITYQNLYSGIDLKWYEKNGDLKYDYFVSPGANYKLIQLEFRGAEKISINKKGELLIKTPLGELKEIAPVVIQNGKQLAAKWVINKNIISFDIKNIDKTQPFIIDPLVRLWGTYYGGSMRDSPSNAVTDAAGNVYMAGETMSGNLTSIATTGAHQTLYGGTGGNWGDAFLVKFNSGGVRQWGTYYGGPQNDFANCVCVDATGNIYMAGGTSSYSTVIATPGSHQPVQGGGLATGGTSDAYLVKFDPNGVRIWGTFYGGIGFEWAYSCVADAIGNVYMCGATSTPSGAAIATPGCQQPIMAGNIDGFIVKFTSAGVRLWGSFYGGIGREDPISCDVDVTGNVYMCGETSSPTSTNMSTAGSHQPVYGGGPWDGFLVKYDPAGIMQWGTYYGGLGNDGSFSVKIYNNEIHMAGTSSTATGTIIATPGTHQSVIGGGQDAFLAKFDLAGVRQWATYYGGIGVEDWASSVTDASGNIYLFGPTSTAVGTVIATPCTYQDIYGGTKDCYVAKFNNSGFRQWGTYYGGAGNEDYGCGWVDKLTGNIYLTGISSTTTGTVIASATSHQPIYGGGIEDAFLVKFDACTPYMPPNLTPTPFMTVCTGNSTTLTSSLTCALNWFDAPTGGNLLGTNANLNTPVLSTTTTFYIEDPSCGTTTRTAVQVTVMPLPVINIVTNDPLICVGQSSTLTASGALTYTWAPSTSLNSISDYSVIATPVANTIYTVTGSNGTCLGSGSIPINLVPQPNPIIIANDNKMCTGSVITLSATGAQTYTWLPAGLLSNPNASVVAASPSSATTFTLIGVNTVSLVSCIEETTFSVQVLPYAITLVSGNVTICEGDAAVLTASGGDTFNWLPNTGLSNPNDYKVVVSPATTSVYSVTVSNAGYCGTTATVMVQVNPKPFVFAGRDTTFNLKEPMVITATGDGILNWISGDDISCSYCSSTQIFPVRNSCYVVEALNSFGCRATDEVCIDLNNENALYIPNTFTPNNDGLNDVFYISGFGISDETLEIYDRWGQKLFTSTDIIQGWNGKYQGQICKEDVYVYKFSYKTNGGKINIRTGNVNLIR